ncbi:MAG: protein-tyrosine phosphatase [Pseudohongiellaceae bacterium]|jgi:protein-tyrosine phosphatase
MASNLEKGKVTAKVRAKVEAPALRLKVLMVCLGNICRSPSAHGVFERLVASKGLSEKILVESAGTANYHIGKSPDPRSIAAASLRGFDLSRQVARQVSSHDYERFDYILAMDADNLAVMQSTCPPEYQHKLRLLLSFTNSERRSVPDPYYSAQGDSGECDGGENGFELVLDIVERACQHLLDHVITHEFSVEFRSNSLLNSSDDASHISTPSFKGGAAN